MGYGVGDYELWYYLIQPVMCVSLRDFCLLVIVYPFADRSSSLLRRSPLPFPHNIDKIELGLLDISPTS